MAWWAYGKWRIVIGAFVCFFKLTYVWDNTSINVDKNNESNNNDGDEGGLRAIQKTKDRSG